MSLTDRFNKAAEEVKELSTQPSHTIMLELYSLFKQATVGDCNTTKPNLLDFKGRAKWETWDQKKGMSQDTAKEQYIQKVDELIAEFGKK